MTQEEFAFVSDADGLTLKGYRWPGAKPLVGSVLIAHGLAEHSLRYERLANALQAGSFDVHAYDHRGHGRSAAASGEFGDFGEAGWPGLVSDIGQCCKLIRQARPNVPLFLIAHSMGSLAAQSFLLDYAQEIDGLILSGSADFGAFAQEPGSEADTGTMASFNAAFEPARTPFDWLSRDEAEVDQYIADPYCGFEPGQAAMASLGAGAFLLSDPLVFSNISKALPVFVFSGDEDPVHGNLALFHSLIERLRAAPNFKIDTRIYAGGRHEMLNETNREDVVSDILAWLRSHI